MEGHSGDAELVKRGLGRQIRRLDESDDLQLLRCTLGATPDALPFQKLEKALGDGASPSAICSGYAANPTAAGVLIPSA